MSLYRPADLVNALSSAKGRVSAFVWPTSKSESWKYNKLDYFYSKEFKIAEPSDDFLDQDEALAELAERLKDRLVGGQSSFHLFVFNGVIDEEFNAPALHRLAQLGVELSLSQASSINSDNFVGLQHANQVVGAMINRLTISKTAVEDLVIQFLHVTSEGGPVASFPTFEVTIEEGAQARIIESQVNSGSSDAGLWRNSSVVIRVKSGGSCHYVIDQALKSQDFLFHGIKAFVADDAALRVFTLALGGGFSRFDLSSEIGVAADVGLYGLSILQGSEKVYHSTDARHLGPEGKSEQVYKSVVGGKAQLAFIGRIRIEEGAQKVASRQVAKSLLLSSDAEVDAKPSLEIFADDVKANHGATVGQIDESQIFYLRSRGISEASARTLVAEGFCLDVVLDFDSHLSPFLRQRATKAVKEMEPK